MYYWTPWATATMQVELSGAQWSGAFFIVSCEQVLPLLLLQYSEQSWANDSFPLTSHQSWFSLREEIWNSSSSFSFSSWELQRQPGKGWGCGWWVMFDWTDVMISGLQCQCLQTRFTLQRRVQVYHGRANKVCSIAWWAAPENWGWGVTVTGQVLGSPTYQRCHITYCHMSYLKCQMSICVLYVHCQIKYI